SRCRMIPGCGERSSGGQFIDPGSVALVPRVGGVNYVPAFGCRPERRCDLPALQMRRQTEKCFELASKPSPRVHGFAHLVRCGARSDEFPETLRKPRKPVRNCASPTIA